ncbi:MAG: DUF5615 family PIN-like protein [Thermoguttaceae bacterium]
MSIALYFDHNVRGAIVHGLRQRGVDVLVAIEDSYAEAEDPDVLARATEVEPSLVCLRKMRSLRCE